jgi:CHASE3 domain sensor protein
MKTLKKVLRLFVLGLLILLAIAGISITGASPLLLKKNEQDYDNEIKTELVEGHTDVIGEKEAE